MRRLHFVVPDPETARAVFDELLRAGMEWRQVRVVAREDISTEGVPEASLFQRSDVLAALRRGLITGSALGLGAGIIVALLPVTGSVLGGTAVLVLGLTGAIFGALSATMIAVDVPNPRIRRFQDAIDRGELLLMVDLPAGREDEIERLVKARLASNAHDPAAPDGRGEHR